jgi:lipoprotein-releasing system ATP-binding protein
MTKYVLQAENVSKIYDEGPACIEVLHDISIAIQAGEMVAIVGASGSGKSTLLHILGLLDMPTHGSVSVDGTAATYLTESGKSVLRNRSLGFVYQFHHLLPEFSALDNVAMPLIVRRMSRNLARRQAQTLLEQVGLAARASHFPGQLSGGERQRVALARALVTRPVCVLADEPTGNLDRNTAGSIFELLTQLNHDSGTAFVLVTHDQVLAQRADRQLAMERGRLV